SQNMKKQISVCLFLLIIITTSFAQTRSFIITPDNLHQLQEIRRIGQGGLSDAMFSPNGEQIAILTTIGVWLYDVNNLNAPVRLLENRTQPLGWANYSPDGTRLLTIPAYVNGDGIVQVWDVATGEVIHELGEHTHGLRGGVFSPDGKTIFTVPVNDDVWAWNADTGEWEGIRVVGITEKITANMVISPTGQTIATNDDKELFIWDATSGSLIHTITTPSTIYYLHYHPQTEHILTAHEDGHVRIWDTRKGDLVADVVASEEAVISVAYAPSGELWASAGRDNQIHIWNATGQRIRTIPAHDNNIVSVNFSPNSSMLISASIDNTVKLWDVATATQVHTISGYGDLFETARYNGDGTRIAVLLSDAVSVFDVQTGMSLRTFRGHRNRITSIAYHPTQERIITGGYDNTVRIWDADKGTMLHVLRGHTGAVTDVRYTPSGEHIVSASADGSLWLWNADTGAPYRYIFIGDDWFIHRAALSPDEQYLAVTMSDGWNQPVLRVWSLISDPPRLVDDTFSMMYDLAWYPRSPFALSIYGYNGIYIMHMNPDETLSSVYHSHERYLTDTAFSPDGQVIAYSGSYGRVYVLPFENPEATIQLLGHTLTATSVQFSPDGYHLLTASHDGTLRIWGIPSPLN
ncbi:MAG: PD40 domain-containing protein, partial [Anaerolineae bacterium]|nr:PD40 domain-containing protein [Anaerolineae bacterium]